MTHWPTHEVEESFKAKDLLKQKEQEIADLEKTIIFLEETNGNR